LLARLSPRRFTVVLRIHLTQSNTSSVANLVSRFNRELAGDDRFQAYFKPISRLGGPNDSSLPILGEDLVRTTQEEMEKLLHAGSIFRTDGPEVCYASRANSLIVRADGGVAKCTVALYD